MLPMLSSLSRDLDPTCQRCQLCPGTLSRISAPSCQLRHSSGRKMPASAQGSTTYDDKFYAKALHDLADVDDKALRGYLLRKALAWYQRFPLMSSPDSIDEADLRVESAEDKAGTGASRLSIDSRPALSDEDDDDDDTEK